MRKYQQSHFWPQKYTNPPLKHKEDGGLLKGLTEGERKGRGGLNRG